MYEVGGWLFPRVERREFWLLLLCRDLRSDSSYGKHGIYVRGHVGSSLYRLYVIFEMTAIVMRVVRPMAYARFKYKYIPWYHGCVWFFAVGCKTSVHANIFNVLQRAFLRLAWELWA